MTDITKFNMNAPKFVKALEKNGFTVGEKTKQGFPIEKDGKLYGYLTALYDGTPEIKSTIKTEIHNGFAIPKYYLTVAGFIRYGTK